jgi:hypothetical protein
MPVADIKHAMLVWLNFWIAYCHRIFGHPLTDKSRTARKKRQP